MKMKKYIMGLLAAGVLLAGCGESLEDTYSDMAGDGAIRYLNNCTGIQVIPGWERLRLEWNNSQDVLVDSIKVTWAVADVKHDTLLDAAASAVDLLHLKDGSYAIDVCTIGKDKSQSLVETVYGRPYTEAHEVVRTFTNVVTKFYKMKTKNALLFFMDNWNDHILDIRMHYTNTRGEAVSYPLTKAEFDKRHITLEEVDCRLPITISRVGRIEGCPDVIHFAPIELGDQRNFATDFKTALERRYGVSDQTEAEKAAFEHFIDTVRTLEFDYDINTFEDVLLCPSLEKIVLGKNRFLNAAYPSDYDASVLEEVDRSVLVLNEANRLTGLRVERYNNHYFTDAGLLNPGVLIEMGETEMPALNPAGLAVDKVECSLEEAIDWDSNLNGLVDDDPTTEWMPIEGSVATTGIRNYEITITYQEAKRVSGFKVVQARKTGTNQYMLPELIKIQVSEDGIVWKNALYLNEWVLGKGVGETTLIPMAEPREIRYVKVIVNDQVRASNGYSSIAIADVIPYN